MKIEAAKRLVGAPISKRERTRFMLELQKRVPLLRSQSLSEDGQTIDLQSDFDLDQFKKQLKKLGWTRFSRSMIGYESVREDWTWPIELVKTGDGFSLRLGKDDGKASAKPLLAEAAKAILPGGFGVYEDHAHFKKSGLSNREIQKILKEIDVKARKFGFKDIRDEYRKGPLVISATVDDSSIEVYIDFDARRG